MRAWESVPVPSPASMGLGPAPELAVFDTRQGRVAITDPGDEARLYVCGITPYDATHMGHAATYVAFDLAVRAWLQAGHRVRYVQNVTDVDDPLLERALNTGQDWAALAERETDLFREDMTALAVLPPDVYLGAVEAIPLILELIDLLLQRGAVYDVDGDLYFSIARDGDFGAVSGLDREAMLAVFGERGGDPDRPGKRDRLDCLLWQLQRPGEPCWPSEYGAGRPGWHIECAAIALSHLGRSFDVQGGGSDLAFPHHEMSASEIHVALEGEPFAQHYVHAGMVGLEGHKMSKSRGNLVLVSKVRADGVDPRAIRLALLAHHYRVDWEWTDDVLETAQTRLAAWSAALARAGPDATETVAVIRARLADDLDAPGALEAVDAWARSQAPALDEAGHLLADVIDASLGIRL